MDRHELNLHLALEVNRALERKDANKLISSVTQFLSSNHLRAGKELIANIPSNRNVSD